MARVLIDCRWLSIHGPGTVTELLLRGLSEDPPEGTWVLWGRPEVKDLAWPGAEVVETWPDPREGYGQRCWFRIPAADLAVFMHQQRPLRAVPGLTVILDTIPLRYNRGGLDRRVKAAFLRRVAAVSKEIVTISEYSRRCIMADLGVAPECVTVLALPYDDRRSARVQELRAGVAGTDTALYTGRFLPHKNIPVLVRAFLRSDFRASGGRLVLVGGTPDEARAVQEGLAPAERSSVDVRSWCSQDELDRLFAEALFLVQPSLEEGFGLPVREALACGLPVCASDGGALPEVTGGRADTFPAASPDALVAALDACASRARSLRREGGFRPLGAAELGVPTTGQFARDFAQIVERNLA